MNNEETSALQRFFDLLLGDTDEGPSTIEARARRATAHLEAHFDDHAQEIFVCLLRFIESQMPDIDRRQISEAICAEQGKEPDR